MAEAEAEEAIDGRVAGHRVEAGAMTSASLRAMLPHVQALAVG